MLLYFAGNEFTKYCVSLHMSLPTKYLFLKLTSTLHHKFNFLVLGLENLILNQLREFSGFLEKSEVAKFSILDVPPAKC